MTKKTISLDQRLYDYLLSVSLREPEILARLRQETARLPLARMQIAPDQGQFMGLLAALMAARRLIEIGVFTGYSSLCLALATGADARLVACDTSEEWTSVARRYWREAGVEHKIDLRLAPALQTLDGLIGEDRAGSFDFVFIDADKSNYQAYFERSLALLRPGGLILVDNTLWSGRVADESSQDGDTIALRAFNARLQHDPRVLLSLLPVGDGLTLALKRP